MPHNTMQIASENDNERRGQMGQRAADPRLSGSRLLGSRVSGPLASRASFAVLLLSSISLAFGCEQLLGPNQAQCDQSVATFRQAISFGQFESASKWRDYSGKVCGDTPVVAAINRELLEAKKKAELEAIAAEKREREVAQTRINAAQKIWRKFDSGKAKERTAEALAATLKSAKRQSNGLSEEMVKQLNVYNAQQMKLRKAQLKP